MYKKAKNMGYKVFNSSSGIEEEKGEVRG